MNLDTNISNCTFTIKITDKLTFDKFYDFIKCYQSAKDIGSEFIVDLRRACHIDVSGLGMLLLLQEYVDNIKGKVSLVFPDQNNQVNRMLKIANFDKTFKIKQM